jgi:LPXTG-site transpeptidase (sortase) family protein
MHSILDYQIKGYEFKERGSTWILAVQATAVFLLITFILFAFANYQVIAIQMKDWMKGSPAYDSDKDGMPNWWEEKYNLTLDNKNDAFLDPDNDGLNNYGEFKSGTDPYNPDTDGDGYKDGEEIKAGYNPNGDGKLDTDGDGMPDWWEARYGLDSYDKDNVDLDPDNDGLNNLQEFKYKTHPLNADTDRDGVSDGKEITSGENPNGIGRMDSDYDGMSDQWERKQMLNPYNDQDANFDNDNDGLANYEEYEHGTDPYNPDTDGDGYKDGEEIKAGYNPNGDGKLDTDGDGMPDWWEAKYNLNLNDKNDADLDMDSDGLKNIEEYKYGTDPLNKNTDGDEYDDGQEVKAGYSPIGGGRIDTDKDGIIDDIELKIGIDPNNSDSDNDGLSDGDEINIYKTDPLNSDSDDDGYKDGEEVRVGHNPNGEGRLFGYDADQDGLSWEKEEIYGTGSNSFDSDGDGYRDGQEVAAGYDPSGPGRPNFHLKIEKLNLAAPIIWPSGASEEIIQEGLDKGVVIYPTNAAPGQSGNCYITGHSSDYWWKDGKYKQVFSNLDKLEASDGIIIEAVQKNNKIIQYVYQVISKEVVGAGDPKLFADTQKNILTLTTCWPIGTNWKRLMIKAELKE